MEGIGSSALASLAEVLADRHGWSYWHALLRALEIEHAQAARELCARPVLDLGCGDGVVASRVFGRVDVGVDLERAPLRSGRSRYRGVVRGDGRRLPFGDGTFRTVYSNRSLEQMDELPLVLSEVARVLTAGGTFLFLVQSSDFAQPFFALARLLGEQVWTEYRGLQHQVNLLDRPRWEALLRQHGFEVRQAGAYGTPALARAIGLRDLLARLDPSSGWPPVRVRPEGQLASLADALPRPSPPDPNQRSGPWLLIAAERCG